mmetsp:Transcript_65231/g.77217  ORF Transcript_65231/g.77217 Transcript_65231/m.77217 type:complete len:83 (+) Transcript_65231:441-689(+)
MTMGEQTLWYYCILLMDLHSLVQRKGFDVCWNQSVAEEECNGANLTENIDVGGQMLEEGDGPNLTENVDAVNQMVGEGDVLT